MASKNNLSGDSSKPLEIEKKVRETIIKIKSKYKRFNVLVIGKAGAGKSSFINSMHMAAAHVWHEVASYGDAEGRAITTDLVRYEMFPDYLTDPAIDGYDHNVFFWDTAGLENFESEVVEKFLGLIMEGRVPPDTNIHAYTDFKKPQTVGTLEKRFPGPGVEEHMCHRIVFVCAADEEPPLNLMSSVVEAAGKDRENARHIPMFLVMTKYDKICEENRQDYEKRKNNAAKQLKVAGNVSRFKELSLYCMDLTGLPQNDYRGMRSDEDINNNLLNLWMNLLSAAYRVKHEKPKKSTVCPTS